MLPELGIHVTLSKNCDTLHLDLCVPGKGISANAVQHTAGTDGLWYAACSSLRLHLIKA